VKDGWGKGMGLGALSGSLTALSHQWVKQRHCLALRPFPPAPFQRTRRLAGAVRVKDDAVDLWM